MPTKKTPTKKAPTKKSAAKKSAPRNQGTSTAKAADSTPLADSSSEAAALAKVRPQLAALPAATLKPPRCNVRESVTITLAMVDYINQSGLRPRLARLASVNEFDMSQLELLPQYARATWYIRQSLDLRTALSSNAMIPAALAEEATTVRTRMQRVLDFYIPDDSEDRLTLEYIRKGKGYEDLADDLKQLADLYATHRAGLTGTPSHYDPADQQKATQLATNILVQLGLDAPLDKSGQRVAEDWADLQKRAMTLLTPAFDRVAAAGFYLSHGNPAAQARFGSLYRQVRNSSLAKTGKTKSPKSPKSAPATDATAG